LKKQWWKDTKSPLSKGGNTFNNTKRGL
jgi:hypothetical protein